MKEKLYSIEFDFEGAIKWINNCGDFKKRYIYLNSVECFRDERDKRFSRNKTNNRLDTHITNLKKELRIFIQGNFVIIDLKNSQPYLLSKLIQVIISGNYLCCYLDRRNIYQAFGFKRIRAISTFHQFLNKHDLVTLNNFNIAVQQGILYDDFLKNFPDNLSRSDVKDIILKVLYSRNICIDNNKKFIPYVNEKATFAKVYPSISQMLKILKVNNHKDLPIFLQKLESFIFIDVIAPKLVEQGIVPITIHDSIIVETEHQLKAIEIIEQVFIDIFNEVPQFHVNHLVIKDSDIK